MIITEFDIQICRENVFKLIDCDKDSVIYEAVTEEFEELLEVIYSKLHPVALLEFGKLGVLCPSYYKNQNGEVLFCLTSVGGDASAWSTEFFDTGDYLKGMLADAMADDYLFQMDLTLSERIIELCHEKGCGVSRRLEAPQDISMNVQKVALEVTNGEELAGIQVLESMMFRPVKTTCQIYLLDENPEKFRVVHNCSTCPNVNCKVRKTTVEVTIDWGDRKQVTYGAKGQTILDILRMNGVSINAVCGGKGICGKCQIIVTAGNIPAVTKDVQYFSAEQLEAGYRLACCACVEEDCTIRIKKHIKDKYAIITDYEEGLPTISNKNDQYGIAVDIGTTTVVMQLIAAASGRVQDTYAAMNAQRVFGADVISRIEASNTGKGAELQQAIRQELRKGINELTKQGKRKVERMVIGGNTTMIHLLMGYSCETLGISPFTPVNIETIHTTYGSLFGGDEEGFGITVCPGISAYVGGDITAGLLSLDFDKRKAVSVLIDLGTNGEMAIGNEDKILVTSTAAGPAFEGGNIICGTGSVPGAICALSINRSEITVATIDDQPACGICGTGVIDAAYELLKEEYIDETGKMEAIYFDEGIPLAEDENGQSIVFYQKDVREIQLAKAAIRAGMETLVLRYGISWDMIDEIYVAGGFGYHINVRKAVGIGLFPEACENRIKAVGNTCLKGACRYMRDPEAEERMQKIIRLAEEIPLAADKKFNELYMEQMYFEIN